VFRRRPDTEDTMKDRKKTKETLTEEFDQLRRRLSDAEKARAQSEAALRDSEGRFRSLVDGILDVVLILDWDGTILFANKAAADCVGVPNPEAGLGRNAAEFIHPDYLEAAFRDLLLVKEGKGGFFSEYIMRTSRGEEKWVEGLGTKIAFGGGTVNLVTLRDISSRKRAALELRDSQEHFQAIVQNVAEGIVTIDENGRIGLFNEAAQRIFGYRADEVVGRNVNVLMPEEYRDRHDLYLKLYLKEPEKRTLGVGREVPGRRKDGSVITIDISLSEILLSRGRNFVGVIRDVTEIRRTEQRLRDLTAMQRAILNNAGYAIISTDPEGTIVSFNAAAERLLGWKAEEMIGRKSSEVLHDAGEIRQRAEQISRELKRDVAPGFDVLAARVRRGGEDEQEWTYIHKDGRRIPVVLSVTAMRDEQGAVTGFVGIARDITLRRRAEDDRRKLYRAVEQSPSTVVVTDVNGTIEYVNPKFTQITGYSAQEALGQNPRILKSGEMPPERYRELWETITAGNEWRGVFHNKKKNGQLYWEAVSISPVKDDAGRITHFVAVKEDITEMRAAQEELAKLSLVASKTDNAVIITDREGRIEWVNDGFSRITGYTLAEVAGRKPGNILRGPLTDAETEGRIRASLASRKSFTEEILNYRKDGGTYWLSMTITPVLDEKGDVLRFVAIESDITGRKRTEEELHKAKLEAESANRAKSEFLASMSHEIRTPMNAILGMADLLWESDLTEEQKKYVGVFRSAGENLLNLINDILDLSKVESGRLTLEAVPFSLEEVLGKTCDMMSERASKKGLELVCRIRPGVPARLVGDPVRLRQVLLNLIGNAVKFTEKGEVLVEVGPGASGGNAAPSAPGSETFLLEFRVADTGVGIPPDKLDAIFERFTQADSSTTRKYGGSGLGLTISRQLVELMNGRIGVKSDPGKGSTFTFTARFGWTSDRSPEEPKAAVDIRGLRTLVVDDNETNRLILMETLSRWGAEVSEAADGPSAIRTLDEAKTAGRPFDLAILDQRMPGMDGFQLAEQIRTNAELGSLLVMMLSSESRAEDRARARSLGMSSYLVKPVKRGDLMEAILTARGKSRPPAGVSARPEAAEPAPERSARILLVEDMEDNRLLVQSFLRKTPFILDIAENGKVGLEKYTADPRAYDIVLMDMQMPVMDGYTAAREIRKWELRTGGARVPIVALTAHALKEDIRKSIDAGCDDHLTKPIRRNTLLETIRRYALADHPGGMEKGDG
jgi:PAS domain S-box-containing protein